MFLPRYIKLVTFGQPRTGDYDYADFHDAAFPYSYRVVSRHDPVPHTPPQEGDDQPFHHLYEVWYNNDMAIGQPYTICEEADGIYCSNTVTNKVDSDHWFYFNRNIKEWGQNGCPALNSKTRS
ncbi:unnamed protein product [Cylicostephanus goldi]|uniref:Fungal lipase-type domain-containing protein n=1 Tax=Cylicostephanus goldi TaxID=71465 RepID=A0A3P6SG30_CYLGO|nr:unnamed protein product [Cylicostephanus goldi]